MEENERLALTYKQMAEQLKVSTQKLFEENEEGKPKKKNRKKQDNFIDNDLNVNNDEIEQYQNSDYDEKKKEKVNIFINKNLRTTKRRRKIKNIKRIDIQKSQVILMLNMLILKTLKKKSNLKN